MTLGARDFKRGGQRRSRGVTVGHRDQPEPVAVGAAPFLIAAESGADLAHLPAPGVLNAGHVGPRGIGRRFRVNDQDAGVRAEPQQ